MEFLARTLLQAYFVIDRTLRTGRLLTPLEQPSHLSCGGGTVAKREKKVVVVVATKAPPYLTGPAVNTFHRAKCLAKHFFVIIYIPMLDERTRKLKFGTMWDAFDGEEDYDLFLRSYFDLPKEGSFSQNV